MASYKYKIEVLGKGKKWYWRMSSSNGRILAHSEQYTSKASCSKVAYDLEDNLRGSVLYVNPKA